MPSPKSGQDGTLLRDLARRAKKARQDGTSPDNEAAIRSYNERHAILFPVFIVGFVITVIAVIVTLVM